MPNESSDQSNVEQDSRFPSGPWIGFFIQPYPPFAGRNRMELHLTFRDGLLKGEGRDYVGEFLIVGRYQLDDGKCWWTKRYIGQHDVFYDGFNEGKGIWGNWNIDVFGRGGFHIWPKGMADPTVQRLQEQQSEPIRKKDKVPAQLVASSG